MKVLSNIGIVVLFNILLFHNEDDYSSLDREKLDTFAIGLVYAGEVWSNSYLSL